MADLPLSLFRSAAAHWQCGQLACTTAVVLIDLDSRVRLLSVDDDAKVSYKEANEETTIYVIVLWGWSLLG